MKNVLVKNVKNNVKHLVLTGFLLSSSHLFAGSFDDYFRAVQQNNESKVIELTLRGFDLNTRNEKNEHALMLALQAGSLKVADFLLAQNSLEVEARNAQGESPLMIAAIKGHLAQAQRLIERRAEVNKPGWTPLHYAASNAAPISVAMVRLLLAHHAYIDAESPNRTTPLMMAAHYGSPAVVKLLLEEGADSSVKNEIGLTAIDFANRAGRTEAAATIAAFVRSQQPVGRW
ncbi:MAG: ankyrin repeat domain-containing protein [Hydrogenophaga sp.]|uniref:ankyrin repeat domain-containing protein n=1 Tax=Hydrogenophaga sp. TaxID=1904254 RepID=UPI0027785586|nr:ankyrin repeat domain-containing protein [Hydrogenophaga sp.]MDP2417178.1 ankyrin repeat domain-containing protein [Hydrogenophaga sp.]MDZ4187857.1 ankyrin repeat domain-containing protein [Hydrogenophaga sp.]